MKYLPFLILFYLSLLLGCHSESPYPGYSVTNTGTYYKLIRIGETEQKPTPGDYITIDLQYATMSDSVFFDGRRKLELAVPSYPGSIEECFTMLSPGDEARFVLKASPFFEQTLGGTLPSFLDSSSNIVIDISMLEIQTKEEYEYEKEAFLKWIQDFGEYENVVLNQYLKKSKLDIKPTESGIYKIPVREGTGRHAEKGDTVIVHYEGKFLNGKFFDSTKKRNEPFGFVYGTEWQVIEGLEDAIGTMKEGEKSIFILPSKMAFGSTGSSTGIIPPYTSVIFEVELIELN